MTRHGAKGTTQPNIGAGSGSRAVLLSCKAYCTFKAVVVNLRSGAHLFHSSLLNSLRC